MCSYLLPLAYFLSPVQVNLTDVHARELYMVSSDPGEDHNLYEGKPTLSKLAELPAVSPSDAPSLNRTDGSIGKKIAPKSGVKLPQRKPFAAYLHLSYQNMVECAENRFKFSKSQTVALNLYIYICLPDAICTVIFYLNIENR